MDEPKSQDGSDGGASPPNEPHDSRSTDRAENGETESVGKIGNLTARRPSRQVNSGVRYYNLQGFANRVEGDNWDYTIEVLVARPNWAEEVEEEQQRQSAIADCKMEDGLSPATGALMASSPQKLGEKIQRVRIRSPTILHLIYELALWGDSSLVGEKHEEIVFGRPFRTLEYCHEGMQKKLTEMEAAEAEKTAKNARAVGATNTPANQAPVSELKIVDTPAEVAEGQQGVDTAAPPRPTPLEDMRVYVAFVENMIMPMWKRFERVEKGLPPKILYSEIPFLFKPGDLAYVAPPLEMSRGLYPSTVQTMFKVIYCVPRDLSNAFQTGKWVEPTNQADTSVHLHCLDYDGERFKPIYYRAYFPLFEDETEITSLPCYPLRFHLHYKALLRRHTEVGQLFRNCVEGGVRHLYYSGWTLVGSMFPNDDKEDAPKKDPEHIESEVVIDFKEATRHIPDRQTREAPSFSAYDSDSCGRPDLACRMTYWAKNGAQHMHQYSEMLLIREDNVHVLDAIEFFKNDRWVQGKEPADSPEWNPVDLATLPRRILAYVLRERKFARLDAQSFKIQPEGRRATLDDIKMKPSHLNIIRSTVSSHFDKKEKERNSVVPEYQPDVIQGKGKGVVILLHGAPGVGKTATAEAVAQEHKKPLFPITCGDLGVTPELVEKTLKDIFRYAHLWDCVLLLDEADVFLTQRDRTDVERNALVSVFLRVLEYYSGILFLTTNRVGALDEAFRSRIHISLYYPHLSRDNTLAILRDNLNRLPRIENVSAGENPGPGHIQVQDGEIEDFVTSEFDRCYKKHKQGPWNGRQIRNAVQIASCLALYEVQSKSKNKNVRAVLTGTHFKTVAETTAEFDRYLKAARRADEAKLAHIQGDRFDGFDDQNHDDHDSHEPDEFEPMFPSRRRRGGGGARGQDGRRSLEPQNSSRRLHSPNVRSSNVRGNQYLNLRGQRYPDDYDGGHGRSSDRRPQNRNYRPRTAEDDTQYGESDEHDDLDVDRGGPGRDGMDGRDVRDNRDLEVGDAPDVRRSRDIGDNRDFMGNGRAQTGFSGRRANVPASRRDVDSHDEDERHGAPPYDDPRDRDWDDERDTRKPAPRGDIPKRGSERWR